MRGELTPAQEDAAGALLGHETGVLSAPTAFGKTVVAAWLKSASHCKILMSRKFTQLGVGFASGSGTYRNYTTADFGKPR